MNWLGTICPNPLVTETPVSPNIQSSFPLGSATLWPSSRPTDLKAFSYCERRGTGVADAGDALEGGERLIESAEAASINIAATQTKWTALAFHNNRILPMRHPPRAKLHIDSRRADSPLLTSQTRHHNAAEF
jgi:hypothetical protein